MSNPQTKLTPKELLHNATGLTATVERLMGENVRLSNELCEANVKMTRLHDLLYAIKIIAAEQAEASND